MLRRPASKFAAPLLRPARPTVHARATIGNPGGGSGILRSIANARSRHDTVPRAAASPLQGSYSSHSSSFASSSRDLFWLAALSTGLLSTLLAQPLLAEEGEARKEPKSNAAFTKDQIGVICVIGGPSSGKTTQLENASNRFDLVKLDASKQDIRKEIERIVSETSSARKDGKKIRVIIEGFPKTLEEANTFENEVVPILLIISIVLDASKGIERVKENDESYKRDAKINWKRFEDNSEGLIKRFRDQGNILEITGEWPKDEVWEQVEAKLESALELDDRGEL